MDMYQKREMRKNKKMNEDTKKFTIDEHQLVKNDLYKLSLKLLFYKAFN